MIKIKLLFVCSILFYSSRESAIGMTIDTTKIIAGTAKITGTIIPPEGMNKDSVSVTFGVPHPISGELFKYEVVVDQSGRFSFDFDVETDTSFIGLYSSINPYKSLRVKSINRGVTNIDIAYDSDLDIKNINITPAMNQYDMRQSMGVFRNMIEYRPNDPNWKYPHLYNKSTDEFLTYANTSVYKKISLFLDNDTLLSKEFKGFIAKDYRLFVYTGHVFGYEAEMKRNYRNATQDTVNTPNIQKIDRSYFSFLKDFNLNDPQYLHTFAFAEFQDSILRNEILALPVIRESDIPTWLASVKTILADLVGFDNGPYYDVLAANAYGLQLREEARPLSEKQKGNITSYWKDGEIAKILFRKNKKIVEYNKVRSPTVVHDISSIPKERVMNEIISKYKNKVVFIDLWATWCGPCLDAMKQFRDAKGDFHDKDIVFVYITNGSSPKKLWEEKIKGIGHDHYYLTAEQWEYMMNHFELVYIPSYLLYNKEGVLINKFSAFPGNDPVKEMINDLLK